MTTIYELSHTISLDAPTSVSSVDVVFDYTVPMLFATASIGVRRNDLTSFYTGALVTSIDSGNVDTAVVSKNHVIHDGIDFSTLCIQKARSIFSGEDQSLRFALLSEIHSKWLYTNQSSHLCKGDQIVMNFLKIGESRAYHVKMTIIIEYGDCALQTQPCKSTAVCQNMVPCPTINMTSGTVSYPGYSVCLSSLSSNDVGTLVQTLQENCSFILGKYEPLTTYAQTTLTLQTSSVEVTLPQSSDSSDDSTTLVYTASASGEQRLRLEPAHVALNTAILNALYMRLGHYSLSELSDSDEDTKGAVQIVVISDSGERSYVNFKQGFFTHITFGGSTYTILEKYDTHAVIDAEFIKVVVSDGIVHLQV